MPLADLLWIAGWVILVVLTFVGIGYTLATWLARLLQSTHERRYALTHRDFNDDMMGAGHAR